jgi:hypothetical protein
MAMQNQKNHDYFGRSNLVIDGLDIVKPVLEAETELRRHELLVM